jgi:hypothetical protein
MAKLRSSRALGRSDLEAAAAAFFGRWQTDLEQPRPFDLEHHEEDVAFSIESSRDRIRDLDRQLIDNAFDRKVATKAREIAGEAGVPDYALDQFTRIGKAVARQLVDRNPDLQRLLAATGATRSEWPKMVGDLIFLVEGGACARRATFEEAEALRNPARWLPSTAKFGPALQPATTHIGSKGRQLLELRQQIFQRSHSTSI